MTIDRGRDNRSGRWAPVEERTPFRAFVLAEPDTLIKAFVFRIL